MHVQSSEEESNFSQVKEVVEILQLQHPLVYDQQDPCALAMEGGLKNLKLPMLRCGCEDLGLDIPLPLVRGKAPYSALLTTALAGSIFRDRRCLTSSVLSKHLLPGGGRIVKFL